MSAFFKPLQSNILAFKEKLDKQCIVFDKTNKMFLDLDLGHEDGDKLDRWCEYNIQTMGTEFEKAINGQIINDKNQRTLLIFFLRIAKEMEVKYGKIENKYLRKLYSVMTSKGYEYPIHISSQNFALEIMPDKVEWMEYLKS